MASVLVVDDEPEYLRSAGTLLSSLKGINIQTATSGADALLQLTQHPATLVVTDLHMPKMDGLELLRIVRKKHPASPVIVMTAHGNEEVAATALNEGASGYVSKRMLAEQLIPIVQRVLESVAARDETQRIEEVLEFAETRFVLGNESELATPIISYLQEKARRFLRFDENDLLRIGLAIDEALKNAIYHGNLEVSSEVRELDGAFHEIVGQRRKQAPFDRRKVHVICRVSSDEFVCVIRDEGNGFSVEAVPDPLAAENIEKASGRGLLLIREFMDVVKYNDTANEIMMVKRRPAPPS